MARKHVSAVRVGLYLPRAPHAGTLEAQIEAADAGEQGTESHRTGISTMSIP